MSGRRRMPRYPINNGSRVFRNGPHHVLTQEPRPMPLHPVAALEEELEIQHEEIRRISSENRHLADDRLILQRELAAVKDDIDRLGQLIPKMRADKESQARELIQKGLKLESELRATEPLKIEVMQLRSEADKLNSLRQELSSQVKGLTENLSRLRAENQQLHIMKADINGLHQDLKRSREAFEYEKKANAELVEQRRAMEKNLVSMSRDIEKQRSEHLSTNKRVQGLGGSYGMLNGGSEMGYPSVPGDGYNGTWGSYDRRGPTRH